jgi:ATP-dependent helicase HrpB
VNSTFRTRPSLPVDRAIPEILQALEASASLVVEAAPGTGKTTRIPPALLDAPFVKGREIWVLEPRRLAAKLSARRVASELGEEVGRTVGYQFRFEKVSSRETRLLFLTEGLLLRKLMQDRELRQVAAVVLDEFHERHLQTDIAISVLRSLQRGARPDLRLLVMSATLDAESIAAYLDQARRIQVEGTRFPVEMEYLPEPSQRNLELLVRDAVSAAVQKAPTGDMLVFLPGMAEMRRAEETLAPLVQAQRLRVHLLHGDLSREEQDAAVKPDPRGARKVILSTNIAESSLTIDGVSVVIDSGLARVASFSPWSGLPSLRTREISRASALQRAGRAGRQGPGVCFRLYARGEFDGRALFDVAEIHRADLAQSSLELLRVGVGDPRQLPWFERPKDQALETSLNTLKWLGACSVSPSEVRATPVGNRLAHLPLHPRLGKLVLESQLRGFKREGAVLAHALSEGGFPEFGRDSADFIEDYERYQNSGGRGRSNFFERGVLQVLSGLKDEPTDVGTVTESGRKPSADDLAQVLLKAFPDRVARRKSKVNERELQVRRTELLMCMGGSAWLEDEGLARSSEWFVIVDAQEKSFPGEVRPRTRVRKAVAIDPAWLLDGDLPLLEEVEEMIWDRERGRVEQATQVRYGTLVVDESRGKPRDAEAAARLLISEALNAQDESLTAILEREKFEALRARVQFLVENAQVAGVQNEALQDLPVLTGEGFRTWLVLQLAVRELYSLPAIRSEDPVSWILEELQAHPVGRELDRLVPETISLPRRKNCPVHYERGKEPWVESRLQDFLGLKQGPTLLNGRVPLTLHLLAPNYRAVQVTRDLAGFWTRIYPELRRELGRRYPRHAWPEDPLKPFEG